MMDPKIIETPTHDVGTTLSAFGPDPAPMAEAPADPPMQEGLSDAGPLDGEAQLPPDLEEMKRELLRGFHAKTTKVAARDRQLAAKEQELAQREAALEARVSGEYAVYDEFGRIVANDPELEALVTSRIPSARGKIGKGQPNDAVLAEINAVKREIAQNNLDSVESELASNPDWDEVQSDVRELLMESGLLATVTSKAQLRQVYKMAYASVSKEKGGPARDAAAQRQFVGQVKKAAAAARVGGGAPQAIPEPEPSSFNQHGRLRSWSDISASERARLNR